MAECEKLRISKEFLAHYKWPVAFRKTVHDRCYCNRCYPSSGQDTFLVGGHTYVVPRGWIRLGVNVDEAFARHHNVWKEWVNCYHGTSIESAKSIVEHRQLLLPRDTTLDGEKLQIRPGHIPEEYYFFTTPTIKYAALDCYACTYSFTSPGDGRHYKIKVALQCKQKSDSFLVQAETVGAQQKNQIICSHIPNDQLEWKTQQRSAIMPYGLMLEIKYDSNATDDNNSNSSDNTRNLRKFDCAHCLQPYIWGNDAYVEGKVISCPHANCKRKFQQLCCPHCSGSIVWRSANYKEGTITTCPHDDCRKTFQQLSCPHCSASMHWKDANYKAGTVTTCPHGNCKKKFQQINCPHCFGFIAWKDANYKEGTVTTCPHVNCKKKFQHMNCPCCFGFIMWKDANYKKGLRITCPYENCKKTFQ
ncbi:hypothetical protein I4U23_015990 [Adineta vaga]|nr:hypothetical protein I4U23_015990 [Adineta vaga]